uniref:Uncharacterized protein n=1 Tax=Trichobilharzia regenti TaxID=157069 RepID=A0AA85J4R9_TRIRE|nr:unnamed protein product [Trichobilharzia regenti]
MNTEKLLIKKSNLDHRTNQSTVECLSSCKAVSGSMERYSTAVIRNCLKVIHSNKKEEEKYYDNLTTRHLEILSRFMKNKYGIVVKANHSSNGHSLTDNDVNFESEESL